jgi:cytochrome c biogenesis protein
MIQNTAEPPVLQKPGAKQTLLEKNFLDRLWDFFSSGQMAIWLLSLSGLSVLIGTIVEQNKSPEKYIRTYGPLIAQLIQWFHIYDLYHSWWFEIIMAFICLNLFLSNFNRAEKVLKKYYHASVPMEPSYFRDAPAKLTQNVKGGIQEACLKLENSFLKIKYNFQKEQLGDTTYYYAEKGKLTVWGSLVAHIGLLLLFVGVIVGHFSGGYFFGHYIPPQGFDRTTMLLPGQSYYIPEGDFGFTLKRFVARWNKERIPTLYRSTVVVFNRRGKDLFTSNIEVNHPLVYHNVKIYQATYTPGYIVGHYTDLNGKKHVFRVMVQQGGNMFFTIHPQKGKEWVGMINKFIPDIVFGPDGQVGSFSKEPYNPGIHLLLVTNIKKMPPDPKSIKKVGWLTKTLTASYHGIQFHFDKLVLVSGFEIKRDLGVPIIFTSFAVIVLGVILTFYTPHKVIRAQIVSNPNGSQIVIAASRRDREQNYEKDFNSIQKVFQLKS